MNRFFRSAGLGVIEYGGIMICLWLAMHYGFWWGYAFSVLPMTLMYADGRFGWSAITKTTL